MATIDRRALRNFEWWHIFNYLARDYLYIALGRAVSPRRLYLIYLL